MKKILLIASVFLIALSAQCQALNINTNVVWDPNIQQITADTIMCSQVIYTLPGVNNLSVRKKNVTYLVRTKVYDILGTETEPPLFHYEYKDNFGVKIDAIMVRLTQYPTWTFLY